MDNIYLDNNATTKSDDRVFAAIRPYLTNQFAHPSSPHLLGAKVREKIEQARDSVAVLLGTSHPDEIVCTSGGTESINTAIKGVLAASPTRNHIVTTKVEHISVLNVCHYEANHRRQVTYLPVDREGGIRPGRTEKVSYRLHGYCLCDVGEQRNRNHLSDRADWRDYQGARDYISRGC